MFVQSHLTKLSPGDIIKAYQITLSSEYVSALDSFFVEKLKRRKGFG